MMHEPTGDLKRAYVNFDTDWPSNFSIICTQSWCDHIAGRGSLILASLLNDGLSPVEVTAVVQCLLQCNNAEIEQWIIQSAELLIEGNLTEAWMKNSYFPQKLQNCSVAIRTVFNFPANSEYLPGGFYPIGFILRRNLV